MIRVSIPDAVVDRMRQALRRAGSREIGGILMGEEIESGSFRVVDFSVDEVSGTRAHFVRDAKHHIVALDAFFQRTGHDYQRFNYLGEWHSHPGFPPLPSSTDIDSMEDLVAGERAVDFGVLLIVKLTLFRQFALSMTLHRRGHTPEAVNLHIGS